jgi:hypothetical protein
LPSWKAPLGKQGWIFVETVRDLVGMAKAKKKNHKDSQLVMRLPKAERDAFVSLCKDLDTSAAREIRRFIRQFLVEHKRTVEEDD